MSKAIRGRKRARRRGRRMCYESLEQRWMLAAELEPNNSAGLANPVSVSSTPNTISGIIGSASDLDFFSFTLSARSGVFFDIDSRDVGLSATLDTSLTVYDSTGSIVQGANNNGRDWDDFTLNDTTATPVSSDSSLYLDMNPGTYVVKVSSNSSTTGSYALKLTADSGYMSSVPTFNSLPGATDTLYLDFDGYSEASGSWGSFTIAPYDLNGNANEWTPLERLVVYTVWQGVAEDYAPFNLNVSTNYAGPFTDTVGFRQVIGNSNASEFGYPTTTLGVSYLNSYASGGPANNTAFTFGNNFGSATGQSESDFGSMNSANLAKAIEMANTSSHEFGHALGLLHYGGSNPQLNALMHTPDFGLSRERWVAGMTHSGESPVIYQDDVAIISNATNTFGYRADDVGNTRPAATILNNVGNTYSASGLIHQVSDVDVFRFSGSGSTTIALNIQERIGNLDGEVWLYDAAGNLLSTNETSQLSASLTYALPSAGNYYVEVHSDGGPGEIGQYALSISTTVPTVGGTISGKVFRDTNLNNSYESPSGDSALAGVTVFLDSNNNGSLDGGEPTTTSDASGNYSFTGLADGTYNVRQVTPIGYVSNISYSGVVITGGGTVGARDFGNFPIVYAGTSVNDSYILRLNASDPTRIEIVETLNGFPPTTWSAPKSLIPSLTFNMGGGDDLVTINYSSGNPMPAGGVIVDGGTEATTTADRVSVIGSAGNDSFILNNADLATGGGALAVRGVEVVTLSGGAGNDDATVSESLVNNTLVDGGADNDTLLVKATSGDDALVLTYNGGIKRVDRGTVKTAYLNIESLTVDMLGGNDSATINHTAGSPPTSVYGSAGNDSVIINSGSAIYFQGDDNDDTLTVSSSTATDPVYVGGEGFDITTFTSTAGNDTITINATTVSDGTNTVNYSSSEELIVEALAGNDTINISALNASIDLTINCGDNNDIVHVGSGNLDPILGQMTVNGGNGSDTVEVNDSSNNFNDQFTITASNVDRDFFGDVTYATIENLILDGQQDANLTLITSTNPATTVTINEGDGGDTCTVQNSSGPIIFNGGLNPADSDTLNVNGGTFTFNADANAGTSNLQLNVNGASATVVFNATQHLDSLSISAGTATMSQNGSRVLVTDNLTVGNGKLNLVDNDMIVHSGDIGSWNGSAYTGITGRVQSGRGDGSWNGNGIVTSMTDATTSLLTTLAMASAGDLGVDSFDGESVDAGAVLVKYTWGGDADLNGELNGDDYFYIDSNIINNGSVFGFHNGDFDLNGTLDGDDYFIIDANITYAQANPPK